MNKNEFLDKYYSLKEQINSLLEESSALEKEYIESNSPIKASVDNPVLCEVEVTTEFINHKERVKEIRTVKEDKYLVGYGLERPLIPTGHINWENIKKKDVSCFIYPIFRKVKNDGSMSSYIDRGFNFLSVGDKNIVFWEKGKPDKKYMFNFKGDIVKVD